MVEKILFLVQNPTTGGLKNLFEKWKESLEKEKVQVDLKIVGKDTYDLSSYEVIHLFFSPVYSIALFVKLFLRKIFQPSKKVILTYYNLKNESKTKLFLRKLVIRLSSDKLALPSKRMTEYYKLLGIKKSFFLPPVIESEDLSPRKAKGTLISYFGALRKDKGIENLFHASKFLSEKIYLAGFIVGGKKSQEYYERISSHKNMELFSGPHLELISKSGIVLFPYEDLSSTIDMPLALLETMKMGVPVLSSNISPLNSFLPKQCLINNWENEKEVVDKINYLKENNKEISNKMEEIISSLEVDKRNFIIRYKKLLSSE